MDNLDRCPRHAAGRPIGQGSPPAAPKARVRSPASYAQGVRRPDDPAGEPVSYDPKPRVVPLDARPGTYHLKWIGQDGQEKTLVYDRPDAFDAVVHASAAKTASGSFAYIYTVKNMQWSGQDITGFAVQNFSSDVTRPRLGKVYVGRMSNTIPEMREGNWIRFGVLGNFRPLVPPGSSIEFRLESPSPPGLVRCRANGGSLGIQGIGEEPPLELEELWLGYEAWPSGYTIGPMDSLAQKPSAGREHLHRHLDRLVRRHLILKGGDLGWPSKSERL
ncbi:MAG: hypothetical protein V3T83_05145 [Acidobacteriota bacterium]